MALPTTLPARSRCRAASLCMASWYCSSWSSTARTASTSASAASISSSSCRLHASSRAEDTASGVSSLRRMLSPPPPRKENTKFSRESKPVPPREPPDLRADMAERAETGSTVAWSTLRRLLALSATNFLSSIWSSSTGTMSILLSTKITFLPHLRMYLRKLTSLSEKGRSAEITKSTRSERGTYSSVSCCCRSRITLVPGVSTMLTSVRSSAGRYLTKSPSLPLTVSPSPALRNELCLSTEISLVVGRMPSLR
mmetsp:Transcript_19677/g.62580  ORF Transcript_19677/g.62580 Transcript_19677/m.62580 type:complete len:254 (-) Transcript_19677:1114-1875(-)